MGKKTPFLGIGKKKSKKKKSGCAKLTLKQRIIGFLIMCAFGK
jgi:hypothetical protein